MSIAVSIAERSAVATVASLDADRADFRHAAGIALSRSGTRDALLCEIARNRGWRRVAAALAGLELKGEAAANLAVLMATASWADGDREEALSHLAGHSGHTMASEVETLVLLDVPVHLWLNRLADLTPEVCYAHAW